MSPLSTRDLTCLAKAQQTLLSPLTHPSPEAWMHAVNGELKALFHADQAVFTMGAASADYLASPDLSVEAFVEYGRDFAAEDRAGDLVARVARGYYVQEDFSSNPVFEDHLGSAVYNEWYRKHRLTEAIGLFVKGEAYHVPDLYTHLDAPVVANVLLTGTDRCRGEGAETARILLALVQPALAASVRIWQQATSAGAHVAAALDVLDVPLWLYDADGRCLHESAEAGRLVVQATDGEVLRAEAEQLARAMLRGRRAGLPVGMARQSALGGEPLRLSGAYLSQEGRNSPAILVRVERGGARLPSEAEIRSRFGLTPQEARVALLRARGEGTAGIAERLGISVHTARRHTEGAMGKLGVGRAAEIGPCLLTLRERS